VIPAPRAPFALRQPRGRPVRIAGAGPSGLSAAITLARAGVPVEVYERGKAPGCRHHFDLQGIENWSGRTDVLEELRGLGLELDCPFYPAPEAQLVRGGRPPVLTRGALPFAYLVQRGPGPGTLDGALRRQAESLGVVLHCARALAREEADVWATGPPRASVIACGYNFKTESPPLLVGLLDERLFPGGYLYLLIAGGQGTLAGFVVHSFKTARRCLEAGRAIVERHFDLDMRELRPFGGIGYFEFPNGEPGGALGVGEAGGFQDPLFGFGIRMALVSGHLAARSLLEGESFDELWQAQVGGLIRASRVNRLLFELAGSVGHRYLVRGARAQGPQAFLAKLYRFGLSKRLLYRLVCTLRDRTPRVRSG
jgi:flavin-dependent dehydrogenase